MAAPKVTLYTKDNCQQCVATKRWLKARDVAFAEVDILSDEKHVEAAKSLGHLAAPVIIVSFGTPGDEVHWSGFDPGNLAKHITPKVAA